MKKIIYIFYLFLIFLGCKETFAQNTICKISSSLNSSDTFKVKGHIRSIIMRFGDDPRLMYMQKNGILKIRDFQSSVEFKINGCNKYYNFYYEVKPENKNKIPDFNNLRPSQEFIFTCIIFNDKNIPPSYYKGEPFVIIKKIEKAN
ncbi:hypothetical protein I5M32_13315 [Pedobacter sp. SD-b]|uniref:Tissue inhibitor of metalloproteinase n=1 Tax=Pedobacter segetis TaxID=2793069 RepID=A0ABS1BM18_9SPHI|nr:hypothetical protein [Pedobacter segetis]MBK0383942.1 hypothetical protein [Pedobacter segetis]